MWKLILAASLLASLLLVGQENVFGNDNPGPEPVVVSPRYIRVGCSVILATNNIYIPVMIGPDEVVASELKGCKENE